jgi:hypothetical protein
MSSLKRRIAERVGLSLGALTVVVAALFLASGFAGAASGAGSGSMAASGAASMMPAASADLLASETMPAFLNGVVVQTVYEQGYFVGSNATYNSTYGTEPLQAGPAVGVNPSTFPSAHANDTLWVLVPWWGPSSAPYDPAYQPATYGIQEQCAPANIQVCYDHPATIFVPGLGVVPLPGHDHLIATNHAGQDVWWNVAVDLILKQSAWPTVTAFGQSGITSLAALLAAQKAGTSSPDLPTNVFLNFAVVTPHGSSFSSHPSPLLKMLETMPSFLGGRVVQTDYQQGFYVGTNASYNTTFGPEPIFGDAAVGVHPTSYPTAKSSIQPFYVLVPWWGPSATPYAPAYNPAAYGIQLHCAPANVQICWDHPSMIDVPGLGTVPLPGHDHLIGTVAGHKDTWWNVVVVLVTNASAWPQISVFGNSGIVSVGALAQAQSLGEASSDLPTNVFLNFSVE